MTEQILILFDGDGKRRVLKQVGWADAFGDVLEMTSPYVVEGLDFKPVFVEVPDGNFL